MQCKFHWQLMTGTEKLLEIRRRHELSRSPTTSSTWQTCVDLRTAMVVTRRKNQSTATGLGGRPVVDPANAGRLNSALEAPMKRRLLATYTRESSHPPQYHPNAERTFASATSDTADCEPWETCRKTWIRGKSSQACNQTWRMAEHHPETSTNGHRAGEIF